MRSERSRLDQTGAPTLNLLALASHETIRLVRRSSLLSSDGRRRGGDALYYPNQFLIVLDPQHPLYLPDGKINVAAMPRYVHEYWHYWQNISTVAGIDSMATTQRLRAVFDTTLDRFGASRGEVDFSPAEKMVVESLLGRRTVIEGDAGPSAEWLNRCAVDFRVVGHRVDEMALPNRRIVNEAKISIEIRGSASCVRVFDMIIGAHVLEESIALIVENQVAEVTKVNKETAASFPYYVAGSVLEYFAGRPMAPAISAALATSALLTLEPGAEFLHLGEALRFELERCPDEVLAAAIVLRRHASRASSNIQTALASILPTMTWGITGDGLLLPALSYYQSVCRGALDERLRVDLCFELGVAFPRASGRRWHGHVAKYRSCALLQQREGSAELGRDELLVAGDDGMSIEADQYSSSDYSRVLQAQQHYIYSHVDIESGALVSSEEASSRPEMAPCPFYTCCTLDYRRENQEVCSKRPWQVFADHTGCWYNGAVAASLGAIRRSPGDPLPSPPRR